MEREQAIGRRDELSDEVVELVEYRLSERVQERLMRRATIVFGFFVTGLTFLGFVGFPALRDSIAGTVKESLKDEMRRETEVLRKEVQTSWVEMLKAGARVEAVADAATDKLKAVQGDTKKLSDLSEEYQRLVVELDKLNKRTAAALSSAKKAAADATQALTMEDDLRRKTLDAIAGLPSILMQAFSRGFPGLPSKLTGANFGSEKGSLSVVSRTNTFYKDAVHTSSDARCCVR
jgi:hypothetical protein